MFQSKKFLNELNCFKKVKIVLKNEDRSGRPMLARTPEMVDSVNRLMTEKLQLITFLNN